MVMVMTKTVDTRRRWRRVKTRPRDIIAREREATALQLRKGGLSYRAIGAHLNISAQAAHKAVRRGLFRFPLQPSEEGGALERVLILECIEACWSLLWGLLHDERTDAKLAQKVTSSMLRAVDLRAKLLG